MELVRAKRTIFDVMSMLFTAVTFHELFKMAAMDGNSKLQFGQQCAAIRLAHSPMSHVPIHPRASPIHPRALRS